jgi:beta-xylosidase
VRTYQNPVYPHYFADPFVWQHDGVYYAVGTGPVAPVDRAAEQDLTGYKINGEERAFPLLRSHDFVEWKLVGGALRVPRNISGGMFWAPEVAHNGGRFFLYYSASTEGLKHRLRVAVSEGPAGPYEDMGALMPEEEDCPFAIDPHPFRDDDGKWYLFYARDFLDVSETSRAGTALVVDRLENMTALSGRWKVVCRARHDWQRFQSERLMYGKIFDWHTVEGPCVRKREGRYFCFYSGGCYENASYGVDYCVAGQVMGPYAEEGVSFGPRVLKSIPEQVIGPGHHSIVVGPDGVSEYMAYHAWDAGLTSRRMFLDRLVWTEAGPSCLGPTLTPQEVPRSKAAEEAAALERASGK